MPGRSGEAYRSSALTMGRATVWYFLKQGAALVILLAGGDKNSQADDITKARNLARILSKEQK